MNAIIRKELRDLARWIPLCMIFVVLLLGYAVQGSIMGVESALMMLGAIGFSFVAVFFGVLQSVFDARKEAIGFLIHRPVSKSRIFWGKFVAGLIAWGVSVGVPLIGVAVYLEWIGPQYAPTTWKQALGTAAVAVFAFSFYPTAMWVVWGRFWSRVLLFLIPLTAVFVLGTSLIRELGFDWRVILSTVVLFVVVTLGARHAFCSIQFSPRDQRSNSWMENVCFSLICVGLAFVVVMSLSALRFQQQSWYISYAVSANEDGELWKIRTTYESGFQTTVLGKKALEEGSEYGELPDDFRESPAMYFTSRRIWEGWPPEFESVQLSGRFSVYNHDDRLYGYTNRLGNYELLWVVTPQGFFGPDETPLGRFANLRSAVVSLPARSQMPRLQGGMFHYDESGVYQIDESKRTVTQLVVDELDGASVILPGEEQQAAIWTRNGSQIKKYSLKSTGEPFEPIPKKAGRLGYYQIPVLNASLEYQWMDLDMMADRKSYVAVHDIGDKVALVRQSISPSGILDFKVFDSEGAEVTSHHLETPSNEMASNRYPDTFLDYATAPPWVAGVMLFNDRWSNELSLAAAIHGLVAVAMVILLGHWLGLSIPSIIRWAIAGAILGVGIVLALWCIRVRPVRENCEKCESLRRVDRNRCKKCGAIWEHPDPDGTEIIGPRPVGVEVLA